jgi:hypothetical protein
VIIIFVDVI